MNRAVSVKSFSLMQFMNSHFICFFVAVIIVSKDLQDAFTTLREFVEQTLKRSGYQNIKLSRIFKQPNRMAHNCDDNYQQMSEA